MRRLKSVEVSETYILNKSENATSKLFINLSVKRNKNAKQLKMYMYIQVLKPGYLDSDVTNVEGRNEPRHDKTNKMSVRPAKTQISLGIHSV